MYNTLKLYSTGWQNEERRASGSCEVVLFEIYNSKSKFYNTLKLYSTGWQNEEQGSSWKVVTGGETLARDQLSRRAKIITSQPSLRVSNIQIQIGNNSFRQIQTGIIRFARLAKKSDFAALLGIHRRTILITNLQSLAELPYFAALWFYVRHVY